jgi:hypothetical protein
MQIILRTGIALRQGTFSSVIAPEHLIIRALKGNPGLNRFLFLFVCGNYSRLISHISSSSPNFEVQRPFTADQLISIVKGAAHTIIFIEHDATLFARVEQLIELVGSALKEAGRNALVILYSPSMSRSFAALSRKADRLIEIVNADEAEQHRRTLYSSSGRKDTTSSPAQRTLEGL